MDSSDWRRPDQRIGYGRQTIEAVDIEAVEAVLRGDWLTQGPNIDAFEAAIGESTKANHVVAVSNGTAALHLALLTLDVGADDLVVTTANTFLASATAALMCNADVEFVDVDEYVGNLDTAALARRLESGAPVAAVVAVYYAGQACDMARLLELKRRFGFRLVVDASHALGGTTKLDGRAYELGELPGVDAVTLSFHPVKLITTGEGGALLFENKAHAERARKLREHGLQRGGEQLPFKDSTVSPPWFAYVEELGFNYRLSDMQAALGVSQLTRLPEFIAARRRIAGRYDVELMGCRKPMLTAGHAWHLYVVHVEAEKRDDLMKWLSDGGIGTQLHYYPVPLQPLFRDRSSASIDPERDFANAIEHAHTAISLPIYPSLSDEDVGRVVAAFAEWSE
ncbi:MAG: dTDP-4-amino-4,6-dideoxygalactose transaminase [Planctomycetota bacterium]|jgi:dTDP-4-amino-4,6-dideoxygalactose transaminase